MHNRGRGHATVLTFPTGTQLCFYCCCELSQCNQQLLGELNLPYINHCDRSSNETVMERLYEINALDIEFYNLLVVLAERQLAENKDYARFSKIYCPNNHNGTQMQ